MTQDETTLVILLFVLFVVTLLYKRYEAKLDKEKSKFSYDAIQQYLLTDETVTQMGQFHTKPILWIHLENEYNSRHWLNFGSRSSLKLNQGYLFLTMKSLIQKNDDSFRICIIDDRSFSKLVPGWNIQLRKLSYPLLDSYRTLGKLKILYRYGGMFVPPNFLCFQDLRGLYDMGVYGNKFFVCETPNQSLDLQQFGRQNTFTCGLEIFGSDKHNETVEQLEDFVIRTVTQDYTSEIEFVGSYSKWCNLRCCIDDNNKPIRRIGGKHIGIKTMDNEVVRIEDLMGDEDIDFYRSDKMYGILIPAKEILRRPKYEYFARLSPRQVLESQNIILSKYIVLGISTTTYDASSASVPYWQIPYQYLR
jgi:hypothetical protein